MSVCELIRNDPQVSAVNNFPIDWCSDPTTESKTPMLNSLAVEWFSEWNAIEDCLKLGSIARIL